MNYKDFNEYKEYIKQVINFIKKTQHVLSTTEEDICSALLKYETINKRVVSYDENIAVSFIYDVEKDKMTIKIKSAHETSDQYRIMTLETLVTVSVASGLPLSMITFKVKNYLNDVYLTYSFDELNKIVVSEYEEAYAIPF